MTARCLGNVPLAVVACLVVVVVVVSAAAANAGGASLSGGGRIDDGITTVHVISSNHLDVGFDGIDPTPGYAHNVVNRYFDVYFPRALQTAADLRARNESFVWTTQSWCGHPPSPPPPFV